MTDVSPSAVPAPAGLGRALLNASGALIGNFLDWTDFVMYAQFAVVIAEVMFPKAANPATAIASAFLVFGVGFLFRPLGSIVFGHIGDKMGRKTALLWTFWIMGISTILTGLIPSYASIGIGAPILLALARIGQGFGAGGELGGALSYMIEMGGEKRRCTYGSFVGVTILGASFLATFTALVVTAQGIAFRNGIGWRLPFVIYGLILIPVALVLRSKMSDSEVFQYVKQKGEVASSPVARVFKKDWKPIILAIMATVAGTVVLYAITSFWPTYLHETVNMPLTQAFQVTLFADAIILILTPMWGYLSDHWGRKKLSLIGSGFFIAFTYPLFVLIHSSEFTTIILITGIMAFFMSILEATLPVWIGESFATNDRYSGYIAYGIAISYFGGFTPFIAQDLIAYLNTPIAPMVYVIAAAVVSTLGFALMKETYNIGKLPETESVYQKQSKTS